MTAIVVRGSELAAHAVAVARLRRAYGQDAFAMVWLGEATRAQVMDALAKGRGT